MRGRFFSETRNRVTILVFAVALWAGKGAAVSITIHDDDAGDSFITMTSDLFLGQITVQGEALNYTNNNVSVHPSGEIIANLNLKEPLGGGISDTLSVRLLPNNDGTSSKLFLTFVSDDGTGLQALPFISRNDEDESLEGNTLNQGDFRLVGGGDPGWNQPFIVTVFSDLEAPEPSTASLLGCALAGWYLKRKCKTRPRQKHYGGARKSKR